MSGSELLIRALAHVLEATARGAPFLVLALVLGRLAHRCSTAARHAILLAALVIHGALLVAPGVLPALAVPRLPIWMAVGDRVAVGPMAAVPAPNLTRSAPVPGINGPTTSVDKTLPQQAGRTFIAAVWTVAVLLSSIGLLAGLAERRRRWRRAGAAPAAIRDMVRRLGREFGIRRELRVRLDRHETVPVTWGVLRPVILLPRSFGDWPRARRRVVLLHELAHVRRLDALSRGFAEALRVLLWFNPLIWIVRREMLEASEQACDDAVLVAGVRPSSYVAHLVGVARVAIQRPPAVSLPMIRRGRLERRARAILDPHLPRSGSGPWTAAAAALTALAVALPLAALTVVGPAASPDRFDLCPYLGGRHLDRVGIDAGRPVWEVQWAGRSCSVSVRSSGAVAFAGDLSGIETIGPDGSLTIDVRTAARHFRLELSAVGRGPAARRWVVDGEPHPFDAVAADWLAGFLVELDRHTAFAVEARFPWLLRLGGPDAVLAEAARSQGGHAGGIYLRRLITARALTPDQLVRLLDVATDVVTVDAEMASVLRALRERYGARLPAAAYARAAATLRAEAARADARLP